MTIRFEGIEKTYMVYSRPQDRLWEWVTRKQRHRIHVALTGVDFEVQAGETFGLIGENGAGKSTLLKIAAGTIRPTRGQVFQEGRVAALLELGAGFHPEESGYDNIRFMAALHGLEGAAMEDFIVRATAFSELTKETLEKKIKRKRGDTTNKSLTGKPGVAKGKPGMTKRQVMDDKVNKRVKKLEKRAAKGMGKTKAR